ncbi:MAG: efflux RND transporter periplasmic adaptor subunit [Opitutaceae bacterium]
MSKKLWISLGAVGLIIGGIYYISHRHAAGAGGRNAAGQPVIVVAGKVRQQDTPIYLNGIGTVFAFNAVTVRSQIDGTLQSIAFQEGQQVAAGDLLAQIDSRTQQAALDQAKAKQAIDAAQLRNAEADSVRYDELFQNGRKLIDQQTYDTQKALVAQLHATVHADEALVEGAQVQFDYTHITAPIAGRTGLRQIDQGNVIRTSDANGLVVIAQLKPISVVFTLPQQNWPEIQRLTAAGDKLPVIAYDRDSLKPLDEGMLAVVDNQIDPTTGTIKLKATFANDHLVLWPGQFVNVRLLMETRKDGVVVPASVIQRGPSGAFAFVIKADSTVEVRAVQVAQIESGLALIDQGLRPGEDVVVDGQYKLQEGGHVTISPPAGAAPANGASNATGPKSKHQHPSP